MKYLIVSLLVFISSNVMAGQYLLVKDGEVINKIVADSDFADLIEDDYDFVIEVKPDNKNTDIGWGYDNGVMGVGAKFIAPVKPVIPENPTEIADRIKRENKAQLKNKIKGDCASEQNSLLKDICLLVGD